MSKNINIKSFKNKIMRTSVCLVTIILLVMSLASCSKSAKYSGNFEKVATATSEEIQEITEGYPSIYCEESEFFTNETLNSAGLQLFSWINENALTEKNKDDKITLKVSSITYLGDDESDTNEDILNFSAKMLLLDAKNNGYICEQTYEVKLINNGDYEISKAN